MSIIDTTKKMFLADTANHQMTIHLDLGVHRHLTFGRPGSSLYRYHIVTYPGHLVISGDCGSYVFCRLHDMFEFFGGNKEPNIGYWAEKADAQDVHSGIRKFDFEKFAANVRADLNEFLETSPWSDEANAALVEDVNNELSELDENETCCLNWACDDFVHNGHEGIFEFMDFYEHDCTEYTTHFVWCCWAIIYAIEQYNKHKEAQA